MKLKTECTIKSDETDLIFIVFERLSDLTKKTLLKKYNIHYLILKMISMILL